MNRESAVCLLGFGEVGQALAPQLVATRITTYDLLFAHADSLPAVTAKKFTPLEVGVSATAAVADATVIISAVTADQAVAAAESIVSSLQDNAYYLDVNSVSPQTKKNIANVIESAGGRFVEAAVMSPIHPHGLASPILLGGKFSQAFIEVGGALGFSNLKVASVQIGKASATKMCRSVIVKGIESLFSEALQSARAFGVEDEVVGSLNNLLNAEDWNQRASYMVSRSIKHGARRAAEMREVVKTITESGGVPLMSQACVERQAWTGGLAIDVGEQSLGSLLDAMNNFPNEFREIN